MNHGTVCGHADSCLSVALHFEKQNRTLNSSGDAHRTDVVDISVPNSNVRYQIAFHNFSLFFKKKNPCREQQDIHGFIPGILIYLSLAFHSLPHPAVLLHRYWNRRL
jgi:hypothetical protein